jgi:hypothetical protein
LMNEVPLVLSSPTLGGSQPAVGPVLKIFDIPIPLLTDFEDATAMGLDVLTSVCLLLALALSSSVR